MMCEAPPRRWREVLGPQRVLLGVSAVALMVAAIFIHNSAIAMAVIGLGAALLLAAVVMPTISQVEYGFPSGVKVTAGLKDREENLRRVFEDQRPDLELCAKLLCDDPATADELLAASLSRASLGWRGPVGPEIRVYVLCWFVHRLMAYSRLAAASQPASTAGGNTSLAGLTVSQRIAVVLNEIADVGVEDIARMVGLPPAEVQAQLSYAKSIVARPVNPGRAAP